MYIDSGVINAGKLAGSTFILDNCSSGYITTFRILLSSGNSISPLTDSLGLAGGSAYVKDKNNNSPAINSRKVLIQWGVKNSVSVGASTNPFIPGTTTIPQNIRNQYGSFVPQNAKGIIIGISTVKPLQATNGSYGSAVIYDAVGNIVKKNMTVGQGASPGSYGVFWDGLNHNGRIVGNGAYLVIITLKDIDGTTEKQKIKVGVKR